MRSQVWTTIDFDAIGVQSDFARVPYSSNTSAYGWIPVPMICFNGGDGPTALLTAGTHGDEYEGQIALRRIARTLSQSEVKGRVIILPALNQPAVVAGRRNSPLDAGNLNRQFPGTPQGGPTGMIAHYIATELFPIVDISIDLHSGGSSLDYLHVALAHRGRTDAQEQKIHDLLNIFGAGHSIRTDGSGGGGATTLYAAAVEHGLAAITTELGGGPGLSAAGTDLAEHGVRRVLKHYGIAPGLDAPEAALTKMVDSIPPSRSLYAPCHGLFEPLAKVGDRVKAGQPACLVHRLDDPLAEPIELTFMADGIVKYRRFPTLTAPGDALYGQVYELDQ
ncbi:succinylglutamate desuccinylase/aspartoacylase family protein [Allomesorhizobium camelthorni]|uniref:Succinylglutamate desuccinylase n=1 Tax=Allomesorhizobium camelthorni TaxID=475069 RepID=A0A6G4WH10_9HYPH|nr:succinylglutamate desuccinylase/aspartoacylase family protein [Mesorhizobium camelthorni]NGO53889.1 succinylglutamate desuccinylase [Mesorhizobium camelthorni]